MYIRIKTLKTKKYAYLVRSKYYKKRTPKQIVSKYIGRLYEPHKLENLSYSQDIKKKEVKRILKELIEHEIKNHDLYEHFKIDLNKFKILNKKGKSCVIRMNNGYLCNYTLKNLFNFKSSSINETIFAREFARVLIEAGIDIDKNIFVSLFDKIYKKKEVDN